MRKRIVETDSGSFTLYDVKLVDGNIHTLDLMGVATAENHGLLHPDENIDAIDDDTPQEP